MFKCMMKRRIFVTCIILALIVLFIVIAPILFGSFYHYTAGKILTGLGMYEQAYYHFLECEDFLDTEECLNDFLLICGKTIHTQYGYENYVFEEVEYDPDQNCVIYSHYNVAEKLRDQDKDFYNEKGQLILSVNDNYSGEGTVEYSDKEEYQYSPDGYICYWTDYANKFSEPTISKWTYDNSGNLLSYAKLDSNGEAVRGKDYTYDRHGNMTSHIPWDIDSSGEKVSYISEKLEYNIFGNMTKVVDCDKEGNVNYKAVFKYDLFGNQIEMIEYDEDGLNRRYICKYDIKGNLVQASTYGSTEILIGKIIYKYDKDDNKIERVDYERDEVSKKYSYKYDENGNLIQETCYYNNGTIEYDYKYENYQVIYLVSKPD